MITGKSNNEIVPIHSKETPCNKFKYFLSNIFENVTRSYLGRKQMHKKSFLFIGIATILFMLVFLFFMKGTNDDSPSVKENDEHSPEQSGQSNGIDNNPIRNIHEIYLLAEQGKIKELSIIAGETEYEEVKQIYGKPERVDETPAGDYAIYKNPKVAIGFKDNTTIDLRSYEDYLQDITYSHIVNFLGKPDDITYYKDEDHNHIILYYVINKNYQLKWVLDHANEVQQNSPVHHISVVASSEKANESTGNMTSSLSERLDQTTIDEKIGQMIIAGVPGTSLNREAKIIIKHFNPGGIILNKHNMSSPDQTVAYINALKKLNMENEFPLFLGIDQEGGRVAKLPGDLQDIPTNLEIGTINVPEFSFAIGKLLGKMVKAYGFNLNFAPVLDINSNPDNPVIGDRSFSDDPDTVSQLGIETMKGLQSEKIIPVIKHFPGHGDTAVDSHYELPVVNKTLKEIKNLDLIPFQNAIAEGADVVMIAHLFLPEIDDQYPSSLSKTIITGILREDLGFNGVIITDDLTMEAITDHYDIGRAAVKSIQAGSDMVMVAHQYENVEKVFRSIKFAVENGELSQERINQSVARILKLKEKYAVDDEGIESVDIARLNNEIINVLKKYMK